jgi:broad specificity phosphatase PhoE
MNIIKNIKDPIEYNKQFNLLLDTDFSKEYEYETETQMFKRLKIIVNLIKETKYKKILIITHGGAILKLIKLLFNISEINGDYNFSSNCHITYIIYNKKKFYLEYGPSTLHLGIYNK